MTCTVPRNQMTENTTTSNFLIANENQLVLKPILSPTPSCRQARRVQESLHALRKLLFLREQSALAVEAPTVSGEVAVFAHHAMTRHDDRNGIRGAGASDRANRSRLTYGASNLRIRTGRAVGNAAKFIPHAALKRSGLHVERQIEIRLLAAHAPDDFANPLAQILRVAVDFGSRIFARKSVFQSRIRIAQVNRADATARGGDQNASERARHNRVMDGHSRASATVRGGSHAHLRGCALIQTAARTVACVVHCCGHFLSFAKLQFQLRHALRIGELLRRDAEYFPKQARHFVRIEFERAAEFAERKPVFGIGGERLFNAAANLQHLSGGIVLRAFELWKAAKTRPVAGLLRFPRPAKENDAIAMRPLRRARGAAIDFRRANGVNERAIGARAARLHGSP